MNSTMQTAAAGGGSSALAILMVWGLHQLHIDMPSEVAMSATVILMPFVHWGMKRLGMDEQKP